MLGPRPGNVANEARPSPADSPRKRGPHRQGGRASLCAWPVALLGPRKCLLFWVAEKMFVENSVGRLDRAGFSPGNFTPGEKRIFDF